MTHQNLKVYKKSLEARRSTRDAFELLYNVDCREPAELPKSIKEALKERTGIQKEVIPHELQRDNTND